LLLAQSVHLHGVRLHQHFARLAQLVVLLPARPRGHAKHVPCIVNKQLFNPQRTPSQDAAHQRENIHIRQHSRLAKRVSLSLALRRNLRTEHKSSRYCHAAQQAPVAGRGTLRQRRQGSGDHGRSFHHHSPHEAAPRVLPHPPLASLPALVRVRARMRYPPTAPSHSSAPLPPLETGRHCALASRVRQGSHHSMSACAAVCVRSAQAHRKSGLLFALLYLQRRQPCAAAAIMTVRVVPQLLLAGLRAGQLLRVDIIISHFWVSEAHGVNRQKAHVYTISYPYRKSRCDEHHIPSLALGRQALHPSHKRGGRRGGGPMPRSSAEVVPMPHLHHPNCVESMKHAASFRPCSEHAAARLLLQAGCRQDLAGTRGRFSSPPSAAAHAASQARARGGRRCAVRGGVADSRCTHSAPHALASTLAAQHSWARIRALSLPRRRGLAAPPWPRPSSTIVRAAGALALPRARSCSLAKAF